MSTHLTSKATTRFASLLMMLSAATAGSAAEMPVDLGSAANFVVVAATTITNASGPTVIVGNVALFPGTSMTGFPPGVVTGNTEINNPIAQQAQVDLTAAYIDAAGRDVAPITISGNIGGSTMYPGLYKSTSSLEVSSGILTLDAQGDPNAIFIIQMASTFTMTSGQQMVLAGGAKPANIYWVVGSSATLGTTSVSYGNWLAQVSVTIENEARFTGRALARTGAVTVDFNEEFVTSPPYVTNVTSTMPNGTYGAGAVIPIQIEFSEAVTVTGFPELALNTNPGASAIFTSGSDSNTLNFEYEVFSPEETPDLDQFSSSALTLNGGSINSLANLSPADLALADPFTTGSLGLNKDIVIESTPPFVLSILRVDPDPTNLEFVHYDVTFSENVFGGQVPRARVAVENFSIVVTDGTFSIPPEVDSITGVDGTDVRRVTVYTGVNDQPDATFRMDLSNLFPPITDETGNEMVDIYELGETYTVDTLSPFVVSLLRLDPNPTTADSVQYEVTFSEPVDGVSGNNFSYTTTNGTFVLDPSFNAISGLDGTATRTVTVNTGLNFPPDATFRMDLSQLAPPITDSIGNLVDASFNTGETYTVNKVGPSVLSITRLDPDPTSASTVRYQVTFSEDVDGVASGNFSFTTTDGTFSLNPSFASITGLDGTDTREVTVNTGTNDAPNATFRMDLSSLLPTITATASGFPVAETFTTGDTYTVDQVAATVPTVVSITRLEPNPTAASSVRYLVTFSEAVDGVAGSNFSFTITDGTFSVSPSLSSITGADGTSTREITVTTGTNDAPEATFRMDLSSVSPSITATVGGSALTETFNTGETYTVDQSGPTVVSITRLDPTPTAASSVRYQVTFSEPVDGVAGSNFSISVTDGTFSIAPAFASISGSNGTDTREVTVNTGLNDAPDATFRLDLSMVTPSITATDNGVPLSGTFNSGETYTVNKSGPSVVSITRLDPNPTSAATVPYLVTFSEAVDGVASGNFSFATTSGTFSTSPSFASLSGADGTTTRVITVNTGTNDAPSATFRMDLSSLSPSITATSGGIALAGTFNTGETYTVDKSGPTVVSIVRLDSTPTNASTVRYQVTFSEGVFGVAAGNFSFTTTDGLFTTAPSFNSITGADGSSSRQVTVNTGMNVPVNATFRMDLSSLTPAIVDGAGAALTTTFASGDTYTVDKTGPTPVALTRLDSSPTNSPSVRYSVSFNEPVSGVGIGNFSTPTTQGSFSVLPSITSVTGAEATATRTVTINTGTNTLLTAAFRLSLSSASPTITDALGNQMTSITHTGLSYIVDKSAPSVVSINRIGASATNADTVEFEIEFSENVNGVDLTNLSITMYGGTFLVEPTLVSVDGLDGTKTRRITANTGTPAGAAAHFRVNLPEIAPAITDMLGNTLTGTYFDGQPYRVDKTAPAISTITRLDPNPTGAATVRFHVSFTESLTMPPVAENFSINTTGSLADCAIVSVESAGVGDPYIVTVNTGTGDGDLRLDLTDATGLNDPATNPLSGIPYTSGQFYTVTHFSSVQDWAEFDN